MKTLHCNVIMLATDKPTRLWVNGKNVLSYGAEAMSSTNNIGKHLYFTSDREIKEDGIYFIGMNNKIYCSGFNERGNYPNVIVATTDTHYKGIMNITGIPQSFIKQYTECNGSIKEVNIELTNQANSNTHKILLPSSIIKTNSNNTCIIHSIEQKCIHCGGITKHWPECSINEEKTYTKEEVAKLIILATDDCCFNPSLLDDWINKNL